MSGKYDKIIKERLKESIAGILRKIAGLSYEKLEVFEPKLQYTIEREADFFASVTTPASEPFIVHLEFQTHNDPDIGWRLHQYRGLMSQKYQRLVRQYVVYLGDEPLQMPDSLEEENLSFRFYLINVRDISYEVFLQSEQAGEIMLAILGNLQHKAPEKVADETLARLREVLPGGLKLEQAFRQIEMLSQLRGFQNLITQKINDMALQFFDISKDPRYKEGELKGIVAGELQAKRNAVRKALRMGKLTVAEIAEMQEVTADFVLEMQREIESE